MADFSAFENSPNRDMQAGAFAVPVIAPVRIWTLP